MIRNEECVKAFLFNLLALNTKVSSEKALLALNYTLLRSLRIMLLAMSVQPYYESV